jgi:hypothetical protein
MNEIDKNSNEETFKKNVKWWVKFLILFTFPAWLPFIMMYAGCNLSSGISSDTTNFVLFSGMGFALYSYYQIFYDEKIKRMGSIVGVIILMIVYTLAAIVVGFIAGWGGALAAGCH